MSIEPDPTAVTEQLCDAINRHDLEAIVDCFHPKIRSEQPMHPERDFDGRVQLRANWAELLNAVPDLRAELLRCATGEDTAWAEWRWRGTRQDRTPLVRAGVVLHRVRDDRIIWVRYYMAPVPPAPIGVAAVLLDDVRAPQTRRHP